MTDKAGDMKDYGFEDIYPYDDAQTREALARISRHPGIWVISKYLFPERPFWTLGKDLRKMQTVDEFQGKVMFKVVRSILEKTSDGLEVRGLENISGLDRKFLFISNHRDIVMDPAIILYSLYSAGMKKVELCVGSNLLSSSFVEDMMRSNRLVKVYRGLPAHRMVEFSGVLSSYIRERITSGESSIWIAQKQGRSKDSTDNTGQGIVKMLEKSGSGDFASDFQELGIVPVSISYEYESCDALRARELAVSRTRKYVKGKKEDINSIRTGIIQKKGHICLTFCNPLTEEEIASAAGLKGNDRYRKLCEIIDMRIHGAYRLWKTNYMGYDLMNGTSRYLGEKYTGTDLKDFEAYSSRQMAKYRNKPYSADAREIFYSIYGNPVANLEQQSVQDNVRVL